jgi:signal transduction histidine kinase
MNTHNGGSGATAGVEVRDREAGTVPVRGTDAAPPRAAPATLDAADAGFLKALLESLDSPVAACDAQARLVLVNRSLRELYGPGADPQAVNGSPARLDLYHPDGRPMRSDETPLVRALSGEQVRDVPVLIKRAGVRPRIFAASGRQIRGADGALHGAVVAVHEVTDLVRANRFKDCEIAVSRVLAESASCTRAGPGVLAAAATALGWPHAELWLVDETADVLRPAATWTAPGHDLGDLVPERLARGQGLAGTAWQRGTPVWISDLADDRTLISAHTSARTGLRAAVAVPVRSADRTLGVLTFFADAVEDPQDSLEALLSGIAAHVGQFLERGRAQELAAELARAKDEYIGLVGHELRTPLTSISAYTDLLMEDPRLREDQRELLAVVQRNAATLRAIIADLLDLAALDSGHARVDQRPTDLGGPVRDAVDAISAAAAARELAVNCEADAAVMVAGDPVRLRQVVDHLLGNAVKFTPPGGTVTVSLTRRGGTAVLTVSDTGVGIPPAERDKIFNRFFRGAAARARSIPGSGLGLAIARAIVDKHAGTIGLAVGDGPGATFVLRLPALD